MKTTSQNAMVLGEMAFFGSISSKSAAIKFDIWRLSARIKDLRDAGFEIETKMVESPNGSRYAEYSLKKKYDTLDYFQYRKVTELK